MASTEQAPPSQRGPHLDVVAAPAQLLDRRGRRQPVLDVQPAGQMGVGREGVREAEGREARRLDRLLDIHAEMEGVQEHLQHRLHLHVAARRAERHDAAVVAHRDRRVGREPRPLARRDAGGMARSGRDCVPRPDGTMPRPGITGERHEPSLGVADMALPQRSMAQQ